MKLIKILETTVRNSSDDIQKKADTINRILKAIQKDANVFGKNTNSLKPIFSRYKTACNLYGDKFKEMLDKKIKATLAPHQEDEWQELIDEMPTQKQNTSSKEPNKGSLAVKKEKELEIKKGKPVWFKRPSDIDWKVGMVVNIRDYADKTKQYRILVGNIPYLIMSNDKAWEVSATKKN